MGLVIIWAFWFFAFRPAPPAGEEDGGFFSNLNPFGNSGAPRPPYTTPSDGTPTPPGEIPKRKLTKVSSMPVAGYGIFQKERVEKEFFPATRYVDRATGNIYQTFLDDIKERRFSGTVIPKVYEAFFANNGESVIMRYLKKDNLTINTFLANLPKENLGEDTLSDKEITGSFLSEGITDLSISPDTAKIFYLINSAESVSGIVLNIKDSKKTLVFDSPFTEWLSVWGSGNIVTLTTKASGLIPGYVYSANLSRKTLTKSTGDILGLTSLAGEGENLILTSDSSLSLRIYDTGTKETGALGVQTLAEKCTWAGAIMVYCAVPKNIPSALYPDSWYQGEVSFDDQIWKINTESKVIELIADLSVLSEGEEIDAIKMSLNPSGDYLLFVNKKDSFLWKLDLK